MITIQQRLTLVFSAFLCVVIALMSLFIHQSVNQRFAGFVKQNIDDQCVEIVRAFSEQYDARTRGFHADILAAIGMGYVHEGYIVSVQDSEGNSVWDARSCDRQRCIDAIRDIETRMKNDPLASAKIQRRSFPLYAGNARVGTLSVETFGSIFYTENEASLLRSLNELFLIVGVVCVLLSIGIAVALSRTLSRPILRAAQAAEKIAAGDLSVRIDEERHHTKELRELSRTINELAVALNNGERWQRQLTEDISHELRTPLTTLQCNMEAMIENVLPPTPSRLNSCHEEITRLFKLVEEMEQLSILERKMLVLRKTEFDLSQLVRSVMERFEPIAQEKGIRLDVSAEPLAFFGDSDRLLQVLVNLISNAIKYTDHGSVMVWVTKTYQQTVEISVDDTGIGIPASDLPHVFDRFYRSDKSRNRSTGGAGIGLTIAHAIVQAHGGTIAVTSTPEQGSRFTVTLPLLA